MAIFSSADQQILQFSQIDRPTNDRYLKSIRTASTATRSWTRSNFKDVIMLAINDLTSKHTLYITRSMLPLATKRKEKQILKSISSAQMAVMNQREGL